MNNRLKVVIIGGGFGGLSLAQHLRGVPVDITLIDRRNFHLFQPLMYQVATGSLSGGEVAAPLRSVLGKQRNVRVLLGDAVDVDVKDRMILLSDGARFHYDILVVATGSQTSYFGHDEWRSVAQCPKSIEESAEIRSKIFFAFEAAERSAGSPSVAAWLTFVIVGAGSTGIEMAGALAEIARKTLRHDFRSIQPQNARIILIEMAPRVLPGYPEDLSARARHLVERLGVEVLTGTRVLDITNTGVVFENEHGRTELATRTVLWGGGIAPTTFGEQLARATQSRTERTGRIVVNADLTLPNQPNMFVIGDLAAAGGKDGKSLPGLAPVAIQQGAYVAKVIRARLRGRGSVPQFRYFNKGDLAVIGRGAAVANVFGLHFWGLPAWLLWIFVHLMEIVEFQSRVLVFIEWGFLYLTWSRGERLIAYPASSYERADQSDEILTGKASDV